MPIPYSLPRLRPMWDSGSVRREADACSVDWIRRSDNLISCDVPIITTAFEERQAAGSWGKWGWEGLDFRRVFQNRGPRFAQGRCSGVKLSFSLPPAGTYNYSQGPHSETLPHPPQPFFPPRSQRSTVPEVQEGLRLCTTGVCYTLRSVGSSCSIQCGGHRGIAISPMLCQLNPFDCLFCLILCWTFEYLYVNIRLTERHNNHLPTHR
jgi:hypothetical protein